MPRTRLPVHVVGELTLPGDGSRFDYTSLDTARGLLLIAHLGASEVVEADAGLPADLGEMEHRQLRLHDLRPDPNAELDTVLTMLDTIDLVTNTAQPRHATVGNEAKPCPTRSSTPPARP